MIAFFRFLRGYLQIKVWGYSPERFMNLCCNHDILLWQIEKCGTDAYTMNISLNGYFQIRPFVRKTGTKVAVLNRYGLPFLIPHVKLHIFFFLGIIGSVIFLLWTSGYIWRIDVEGNQVIRTEDMCRFLEEQGVSIGSRKKIVDVDALEKKIRNEFSMVTWASLQVEGTRLWIQLKENDKIIVEQHAAEEGGGCSDLVASKDGVISSIITRNGVPQVKAGDEVKKGDLLVSGKVPILDEAGEAASYHFYEADADIYLQCGYQFTAELPTEYILHQYTGNTYKSYYLNVFGRTVVFPDYSSKKDSCDVSEKRTQVKALDQWFLPIIYGSDYYEEYTPVKTPYTKKEVKNYFNKEIQEFVSSLEEKGVQFIGKNVKIEKNGSFWKVIADFTVIEKTGEAVQFDGNETGGEDGEF